MTSSSSFEVTLAQPGEAPQSIRFSSASAPLESTFPGSIRTDREVQLRLVTRGYRQGYRQRIRALVAGELALVLAPERGEQTVSVREQLRDTAGRAVLYLESEAPDANDEWETLLVAWIAIDAPVEVERVHAAIVTDLERIHVGLARDVIGATAREAAGREPRVFDPASEQARLTARLERLERAVEGIAIQPCSELERGRRMRHLRGGDRVDGRALDALLRSRGARVRHARLVGVGAAALPRVEVTHDIAEHRHLRAGLDTLRADCARLQASCRLAAALYEKEARRWDLRSGVRTSVYERRFKPRVQKLRTIEKKGRALERRYRALIERHAFVREAGRPRSPLAPTPIFVGRPAYREVYDALRDTGSGDVLVDGQHLSVLLAGLDTLYEYWVYVTVVDLLRAHLGAPAGGDEFKLIDEVYRPSLAPGQAIEWDAGWARVRAHYEPAIPPLGSRDGDIAGWRASLVGAPLRPDVVVSVSAGPRTSGPERRPPLALAIDAKNTTSFSRDRVFDTRDYRTLILAPDENHQPVRMLFLAHRTPGQTFCSLPRFLEGHPAPRDASLAGAVHVVPAATDDLRRVLERFLDFAGVGKRRSARAG